MVRWSDVDPALLEPDGISCGGRRELSRPGEQIGKVRAAHGGHVQDDEEGSRETLRKATDNLLERRYSSRGGPNNDDIASSQSPSPTPEG
jgi:hypothetical protein